ncbi:MAG: DUF2779 domain-containing protein [Burkholderiales bacterium]|nr:DUF2779 domain-containing protein [Burkholderiales bacterium]
MSTAPPPRYLTKSRFKLALECPTKLFYTGKAEFHNRAQEDAFLHALAEGGFQVGALARLMYPGGVEVIDDSHAGQLATTRELLQRPEVTVYEAALEAQGLFVRVDILRKRGDEIELIEVKAKSYHPKEGPDFRCARGQLSSDMLPYLQDIAFQRYVAALAFPAFRYRCFLMLADKSAKSSVDGINQRFRIKRAGPRTSVEVAPGTDSAQLGAPLLRAVPVDEHVDEIVGGELVVLDRSVSFGEGVALWAAAYRADDRISPRPSSMCASCEFKTPTFPEPGQPRSGFHECWAESFGWQATDFAGGTVLDLWNYRNKPKLLAASVLKLSDVTPTHLSLADCAPGPAGMSRAQRQWFQCSGQWPGGGEQFVNTAGLRAVMCAWRYPLHFIDFETSAVAIPFRRGQHPYETIAFQFSHHVMHADGRVEHKSQFLEARPGVDPTLPFLRALRAALSDDEGTVFRWAAHEKTVLQQPPRVRILVAPIGPEL